MVAAGVYLVARSYAVFTAGHLSLEVVSYIGIITSFMAGSIALVQTDIKRILAYSTVSQLGYMMIALGTGGYSAGVFHLMTHAFLKALLFLCAGSVIHCLRRNPGYPAHGRFIWENENNGNYLSDRLSRLLPESRP